MIAPPPGVRVWLAAGVTDMRKGLGRKNWLFAGSDSSGERAAATYSLIETAKLNDLDPEDYLRHVLERIADHPVKRVHELLAWNVAGIRLRLDQRDAA